MEFIRLPYDPSRNSQDLWIDAGHGHNNVYNATIFPQNVGLGVTKDPELIKKIGTLIVLKVRATGIPFVLLYVLRFIKIQDGVDILKVVAQIIGLFKPC